MVQQPSQIGLVGPDRTTVAWDVSQAGAFDSEPLVVPARYSFPQGAIYRLKLSNIPGRPGIELYPTLEIAPPVPRTEAYLAHSFIPMQLTEEDFDQVQSGNFVTKVIYLPDPEFQELALAGVETLVSTRLDPGVDPIVEADRRGSILAIIRMGNKDLSQIPGGAGGDNDGVVSACYMESLRHARWIATRICRRRDRAAIWHANVRHADRIARPTARAARSPGRTAEPHDCQSYEIPNARSHQKASHRREAVAGLQLSAAAEQRLHP